MNIYQIKEKINADTSIKKMKANYKKETNDLIKIVIRETKYEITTRIELGLEFWVDGDYRNDFIAEYTYFQTEGMKLKEFKNEFYNSLKEQIKDTIINEMN